MGTPQFASPEQFDGGEVDVRSDVYSLGVTLWYALTGNAPYVGDTPAAVHDRQLHRPLPVAQLTDLGTPACFVELLASMLAPDPARRPASATALRAAIEECAAALQKTARATLAPAPDPRGGVLIGRRCRRERACCVVAFLRAARHSRHRAVRGRAAF